MTKSIVTGMASFGMSGQVFHGPSLKTNPHFRLKSVVERSKELSRRNYPEATIVRCFDDLLNDTEIELVIVNAPDHLHYQMTKAALEAGKHVVVEKPFTRTLDEADELIALAAEKQRLLTVYQNRRWDGDFLTVKKILESGWLGRLVEFESHFDRYRNFIQPGTWKEEGDERAGVLYNLGSHMIDQALVLLGRPEAVTAHLNMVRTGGRVTDYYDIRLHYADFAALIKCSYLVRESGPRYTLHGTHGSFLKWGIDPQEEALKGGQWPGTPSWGTEPEQCWGLLNTEKDGLHYQGKVETLAGDYPAFYRNVYEAIAEGAELLVKPEEVRLTQYVLELCLQSHREGRTIPL